MRIKCLFGKHEKIILRSEYCDPIISWNLIKAEDNEVVLKVNVCRHCGKVYSEIRRLK